MHQAIQEMVEANRKRQNKQKSSQNLSIQLDFFVHFVKNAGLSDTTWTCGLYHPKRDLNIFMVILSFFRHFRYGKNDLSRSRGILSPCAPVASMVVYVVVKIRSQIDGFGLIRSGWFFIKISGQLLWSFYHRIPPSGLSHCNSSSAICQEVQQLKFAPQ